MNLYHPLFVIIGPSPVSSYNSQPLEVTDLTLHETFMQSSHEITNKNENVKIFFVFCFVFCKGAA